MEEINTPLAPKAVGPYVQSNMLANLIFTSGQLGIDPETNEMEADVSEQLHQIFKNLSNILFEAGSSLKNVIKTTIFLTSLDDYVEVNDIYGTYFTDRLPARSAIEVCKLPLNAKIEIEVIAFISQ